MCGVPEPAAGPAVAIRAPLQQGAAKSSVGLRLAMHERERFKGRLLLWQNVVVGMLEKTCRASSRVVRTCIKGL